MSDGELDTVEQTGLQCNNCGDTVTPDHPDVAKEMTGSHCHECNDGHFETVTVELVRVVEIRDRIDEIRYECEDSDALEMLHELKEELEESAQTSEPEGES